MKTKSAFIRHGILFLMLLAIVQPLSIVYAQGTAFTYQGRLMAGSQAANGSYDLAFTLFNVNSNGTAIAGPVTNAATAVSNGLFTVIIDFGPGVFTGNNYWLGISVSPAGSNTFTVLTPRQPVLPAPYAIMANSASNLLGTLPSAQLSGGISATNLTGTVSLAQLPAAVVTNNASGAVLAGLSVTSTNVIAPLTVPPRIPAAAIGSVGTVSAPYFVAVAGRYAYVANLSAGTLQVIDVSTPSSPVSVGSVATGGNPWTVAVAGRYAYVANYGSGMLQVIDVSTPSSPVLVGSVGLGMGADPISVAVAGRYAYVGNGGYGTNTLEVFDVSAPSSPVLVGSVGTVGGPISVAVAGRYAYVVNQGSGNLQVIDVSTPSSPVSVGSVGTVGTPLTVAVAGRYAYVAGTGGTLQVFDVNTPSSPVLVGSVFVGGDPASVAVAGRYAYVANDGAGTLQVIDVSTPSSPVIVGSVYADGPRTVAVAGRYAYVANYGYNTNTLEVFDFGGAYVQQLEAGAMEVGTLQTRDTVTVGNNLDVRGGLTASGSARISGGLSVDNGTIMGNGAGLTNLPAANLVGPILVSSLVGSIQTSNLVGSIQASNLVGTISDARLSSNVALLNANQTFSGVNAFINPANSFAGSFAGALTGNNCVVTNRASAVVSGSSIDPTIFLRLYNGFTDGNLTTSDSVGIGFGQNSTRQAIVGGTYGYDFLDFYTGGVLTSNRMRIDNAGHVGIGTGTNGLSNPLVMGSGAYCSAAGVWTSVSDRNVKENFRAIDPQAVLAGVAAMPITEWKYKVEPTGIKHMGPVAQDFHSAFGLGDNDRAIGSVDETGVALAAIQGLNAKLETEAKQKDAEIDQLKQSVAELKDMVAKLAANQKSP
jgi:hypothetical protein